MCFQEANQVGALDLGYTPGVESIKAAKPSVLFMLGADAGSISRDDLSPDTTVVYIGMYLISIFSILLIPLMIEENTR